MIKKSQLLKYFSDFGKVEKIISKFDQSNIAKGYCFVKFVSSESAQKVLNKGEHLLNNRTLNCSPVMKGKQLKNTVNDLDNRRLFVSGLCKITLESSLKEYVSRFCSVENIYLINRQDKLTNIAYVTLKDRESTHMLLKKDLSLDGFRLFVERYKRKTNGRDHGPNETETYAKVPDKSQGEKVADPSGSSGQQFNLQGLVSPQIIETPANTETVTIQNQIVESENQNQLAEVINEPVEVVKVLEDDTPLNSKTELAWDHTLKPFQNGYFDARRDDQEFRLHFVEKPGVY